MYGIADYTAFVVAGCLLVCGALSSLLLTRRPIVARSAAAALTTTEA